MLERWVFFSFFQVEFQGMSSWRETNTQPVYESTLHPLAIQTGIVPPTINLDSPDLENGLDLDYVPKKLRVVGVDNFDGAISASLGFGGHNAALLFRKMCR